MSLKGKTYKLIVAHAMDFNAGHKENQGRAAMCRVDGHDQCESAHENLDTEQFSLSKFPKGGKINFDQEERTRLSLATKVRTHTESSWKRHLGVEVLILGVWL